uniref:hypothetical protein n=1 Tax=Escherichia coli TaxID=562 RepID=UPI001BDC3EC5
PPLMTAYLGIHKVFYFDKFVVKFNYPFLVFNPNTSNTKVSKQTKKDRLSAFSQGRIKKSLCKLFFVVFIFYNFTLQDPS